MKILAFESSAKSASVAILEDGKLLASNYQNISQTHSKTLLKMAESMLFDIGKTLDFIDVFAVANGPGSFTGIRIGVSVVQGLALSTDKKCIGVSSLFAMAHNVLTEDYICAIMDARAGQVYAAVFYYEDEKLKRATEDMAIKIEELCDLLKNLEKSYILVGDGASLWYNVLLEKGVDAKLAPENIRFQNAYGVALQAFNQNEFYDPLNLVPTYLRLPQAERERGV